jgi:hypothetical protein
MLSGILRVRAGASDGFQAHYLAELEYDAALSTCGLLDRSVGFWPPTLGGAPMLFAAFSAREKRAPVFGTQSLIVIPSGLLETPFDCASAILPPFNTATPQLSG